MGAVQVGNAMIAAIADLLISIRTPSVTTIHIVIFQAKMIKDFEEVMKNLKKVIPKPAGRYQGFKTRVEPPTFNLKSYSKVNTLKGTKICAFC